MHDAEVNNYLDSNLITSNKSPRKSDLMLPIIGKNAECSPIKGFIDISTTHMKIRNDFATIDAKRGGNQSVRNSTKVSVKEGLVDTSEVKRNRSASKSKIYKKGMSSKVMETWVRDTLLEAENLDIPGIILQPEK